jgi:hypothetical protein
MSGRPLRLRTWPGALLGLLPVALTGALAGATDSPEGLLERYAQQAKAADPAFEGFSAKRGHAFYLEKHPLMGVGAVSCSSCHRKDPREQIRAHRVDILCRACHVINDEEHPDPSHAKKRIIEPFTPGANAERFRNLSQVDKYFKTNCLMLLKRECTAQEKGDLIAWLLTIEGGTVVPEPPDPARPQRTADD